MLLAGCWAAGGGGALGACGGGGAEGGGARKREKMNQTKILKTITRKRYAHLHNVRLV